ncbi:MAG: hypothetical protein ACREM2_03805 [Vulcanimicrobiaceae bacterium]
MLDGFALEPLSRRHRRDAFRCASASLNDFIRKRAKGQDAGDTTRVHVYADASGRIAGFFTLSAHMLDLTGLPDSLRRGRPQLAVPATLLGRFAVDDEFVGGGLGRYLLGRALRTACEASALVASAVVALDLANDASANAERLYIRNHLG